MSETVRLSHSAALMLKTLKEGHGYGFDIMNITGLPSGTVYPALRRMENDGLIDGTWESEQKAQKEDRPARRYYKVTAAGKLALVEAEKKYPLIAQFARPKAVKA
ncbi:putative transcriptional regulator [Terriglobus roseus DSM 18391]|uniref:Putative transcriptional regulator n=1 Tax=Terriglobus roseus (strain DSM 18391 / NRRL B-41598 / KBS 63) TaxID=926566 RepID=I3ZLK8_TERRK|nr:PadR family transcriptional regulator [Terriglobus roseus]AFL90126.1 putative transcriptional regulator [Terriglobus roseus DSM 18391]